MTVVATQKDYWFTKLRVECCLKWGWAKKEWNTYTHTQKKTHLWYYTTINYILKNSKMTLKHGWDLPVWKGKQKITDENLETFNILHGQVAMTQQEPRRNKNI